MKKNAKSTAEILRQKAEALVKKRPSRTAFQLSETETLKLIHELEVHQIELEMQNEELVQARYAIQETAEKYTELYDFAPTGYFTLSKDGEIIELNFRGSQMLRKDRSQLINSQFGFFISDDTKPIFNLFLEKVFSNITKESCEVTLTTSGDLPMYVQLIGIVSENGEQCIVTMIDITERKRMEAALKESHHHIITTFENMAEGFVSLDNDWRFTYMNKHAGEIFNRNPDNMIGKQIWTEFPEGVGQPLQFAYEKAAKNQKIIRIEEYYPLYDKWFENRIYHLDNGLSIFFHDITEKKKGEIALLESEKRYHTLAEISPVGIFRTDADGSTTYVNPRWCKIAGLSSQEAMGNGWLTAVHSEDREKLNSGWKRSKNTRNVSSTEYRFVHQDGTMKWVLGYAVPEKNVENQIVGYIGTITDITERKMAEEVLRQSEEILMMSQRLTHIGSWNWKKATDTVKWSEELYHINGRDPNGSVPSFAEMSSCYTPESWKKLSKIVAKTLQSGEPYEFDLVIVRPDGTKRHTFVTGEPVYDAPDKIVGLFGTVQDITERKLAENKMQFLILRQEAILASVPEIIAEVDNNKVYTWLNKAGIEFFGEDVIGKEASFYFVDEQKTYNTVDPLFRGDEDIIYLESWQRRKDGENRLLGWWCKSLKDENGIPRGALSTARDITEHRLLQEKEQEYLADLRTLSDTASNLIKVKDSNDVFTELTEKLAVLDPDSYITISVIDKDNIVSLRKIIGIESKFAVIGRKIGVNPYDIKIPISDYTDHEIIMFKSNTFFEYKKGLYGLSAKKIPKTLTIVLEKMMGINQIYAMGFSTEDEIFGVVTLLRKSKGEFKTKGIIETIINQASVVLKRQHVEEEIRQINAELEHRITERTSSLEDANKELEAFSYSVSHDLRAPLRHINGYVEMLSDCLHDSLPEKEKHYLDSISGSAHQMGALIDDLLQFSKASRLDMQQARVDMNDVLQEAMKIVSQDTTGRRIKWINSRLPDVLGDHNLLLLVWINLLSNAVKFTRPKKKARIETGFRKEDTEYVFFVRDNGVGFDMQYAQKLFGVFQRLHSSAEFKGTGIGLANVRRIIHKHGGRTWVEARLNKGATFYFSLPQ